MTINDFIELLEKIKTLNLNEVDKKVIDIALSQEATTHNIKDLEKIVAYLKGE